MGGSAKSTSQILLQLADQGLHPVIIDRKKTGNEPFPNITKYVKQGRIKNVEIPATRFPMGYCFAPFLPFVFGKIDPDILDIREFHNWFSDMALLYGIARRKKIVFCPHGGMSPLLYSNDLKSAIKKAYDKTFGRLYVRFASAFVSNSDIETEEMVEHWGIDRRRIVQIPHGVKHRRQPTEQEVESVRRCFGIRKHHVMFFGRLHWNKGVQYLLKAIARNPRLASDITVTISGPDDGMEARLQHLSESLGLEEHVVFTGFLTHQDLDILISSADVVVNPSNYESFGHSMAEAVCLGKPIVQSFGADVSGINLPFVKNGVNGFIVPFGNVDALAKAIKAIITDPKLKARFGRNSKAISESFEDWKQVGSRYIRLYRFLFKGMEAVRNP